MAPRGRAGGVVCLLAWLCAALAQGCAGAGAPGRKPAAVPAQPLVALVSIAGFTPAALAPRPDGPPLLPTVAAYAADGARADGVEPVTPATTYPAHATLVTGVRPAKHGIPADWRLSDAGTVLQHYTMARLIRVPTLWEAAGAAGQLVASLDWPTTEDAAIALLLPDVNPLRLGESWLVSLRGNAPTAMVSMAERNGAGNRAADREGPARDAVLVGMACELLSVAQPPRLVLLRLSQTAPALAQYGPGSKEAAQAFAGVDRELARWLACLRDAGRQDSTSLFVVGDRGFAPVHTAIAPNSALAAAKLIVAAGAAASSWEAYARSNGGTAFVYAKGERAAIHARTALETEARETGAFRVISADEMLQAGADPAAWFGLAADPGFVFEEAASGEMLRAAAVRGAGGYVSSDPTLFPGFAAWGRGIRQGIRIPAMRQTDVAPTLALLLGVKLENTEGRALVGLFEPAALAPAPASTPPTPAPTPGPTPSPTRTPAPAPAPAGGGAAGGR